MSILHDDLFIAIFDIHHLYFVYIVIIHDLMLELLEVISYNIIINIFLISLRLLLVNLGYRIYKLVVVLNGILILLSIRMTCYICRGCLEVGFKVRDFYYKYLD
jgi:hypothetical protein